MIFMEIHRKNQVFLFSNSAYTREMQVAPWAERDFESIGGKCENQQLSCGGGSILINLLELDKKRQLIVSRTEWDISRSKTWKNLN